MDSLIFDNLKIQFFTTLNDTLEMQDQILWKILFYYFLMKNKEIKSNQISEIEDILDNISLPREDTQLLDEDTVTFLLGYKIIKELNKHQSFKTKFKKVKTELETYWNDIEQIYFGSPFFTLLIVLCDKENIHKNSVITKFKTTRNCTFLSIIFMLLEENKMDSEISSLYNHFFDKIVTEYYSIPDSEKVYVAWILWKYKYLSKVKVMEVRKIVSNYIKIVDRIIKEIKEGNLNYRASIYYDLLYNFEKDTIKATEEVPISYRILGVFSGIVLILFALYIFLNMIYLHHDGLNIYTLLNVILAIFFVLFGTIGYFLIREIGINCIYTDEEIKLKLKKLVYDNVFKAFILGAIGFSAIVAYI